MRWLHDILEYISQESPDVAYRVVEGIYNKSQILSEFPKIGHIYREEPEGEIRILLYGHYRITYLLKPDEIVEILGIFHGKMEIERYLNKS